MKTSKLFPALAFVAVFISAPAFAFRNAAWIPPWDGNALTSIQMNAGALQESNPVWYSMNADGSIAKNWNAENATWRAAMTGTTFVPTVQNIVNKAFSSSVVSTLLATSASRDAHAAAITTLVINNGFDGIDIDYERIPAASRANFTAFVTTLAQKLHAINKTLSVTVYSKTSDRTMGNGGDAEDYAAIGAIADSVKIMAYDYSNTGTSAGPITPLDWLDQVATYAQATIPSQKIMIGLPWYGYDWSSSGVATASYASATQTAQSNHASISRDANGEPVYAYSGHTVYFEDASSYQKKVDLIKQKHASIGGFAHWAAGVEDPALWTAVRNNASGSGVPITPVNPPDFSISGASALTLQQGTSTSADYRIVSLYGFNAATNVTMAAPAGLSGSLNRASMTINDTLTLTLNATSTLAPGTYQVVVHFASGTIAHDGVITVTVTAAPKHATSKPRTARH